MRRACIDDAAAGERYARDELLELNGPILADALSLELSADEGPDGRLGQLCDAPVRAARGWRARTAPPPPSRATTGASLAAPLKMQDLLSADGAEISARLRETTLAPARVNLNATGRADHGRGLFAPLCLFFL